MYCMESCSDPDLHLVLPTLCHIGNIICFCVSLVFFLVWGGLINERMRMAFTIHKISPIKINVFVVS